MWKKSFVYSQTVGLQIVRFKVYFHQKKKNLLSEKMRSYFFLLFFIVEHIFSVKLHIDFRNFIFEYKYDSIQRGKGTVT